MISSPPLTILGAQEAGIFPRRSTRDQDGPAHTDYALVERVPTEAGPRPPIVAYLGELNHDQQGRWQRTVVIDNRQGDSRPLRLCPHDSQVEAPDDPKDRLSRTLDRLLAAQPQIEPDVKDRLGSLVQLDDDRWLDDLTSTYFEGLAVDHELAGRGDARDHHGDCKPVIRARVVTRAGFPLAHRTLAGHTQDLPPVETIVTEVEPQFGTTQRIGVVDRGMVSQESLAFLRQPGRR